MSILSRLTYSFEVKLNMFLQAFKLERRVEDQELQVDALLETFSAKMKTGNCAVIGHLIDTLKFMSQLGILFERHGNSGRLNLVSDIKGVNTLTGNFRTMLQLQSMGNSELAAHLTESPSNATYLSKDIQNEMITLIGDEIISGC